jgi:hypothetical protein
MAHPDSSRTKQCLISGRQSISRTGRHFMLNASLLTSFISHKESERKDLSQENTGGPRMLASINVFAVTRDSSCKVLVYGK